MKKKKIKIIVFENDPKLNKKTSSGPKETQENHFV